jgi:hypothetical protein
LQTSELLSANQTFFWIYGFKQHEKLLLLLIGFAKGTSPVVNMHGNRIVHFLVIFGSKEQQN